MNLSTILGCILLFAMVLRSPDLTAEQTPGLEVGFADPTASQMVPFEVAQGNRRNFLGALGMAGSVGAAALALGNNAIGGEPAKKVAAKAKGTSSIATKEEKREAALNEWRRKHIVKSEVDYKKELDPVFDQARFSHAAEKAYYASMLKPEKYQREYPNGVCASDWGPMGKFNTKSDIHYLIFRVKTVDASGNPIRPTKKEASDKKEEEVSWVVVGLNKNRTTQTNPDGIRSSMTLHLDALQSVTRVENALKEANFVIPSDGLAKK